MKKVITALMVFTLFFSFGFASGGDKATSSKAKSCCSGATATSGKMGCNALEGKCDDKMKTIHQEKKSEKIEKKEVKKTDDSSPI